MGNDIYGNAPLNISFPYTADNVTLVWGGKVANVTNIQISYVRSTRKQHAIGSLNAVINPTRPAGQLTLNHLMIDGAFDFTDPGWANCDIGTIDLYINPGCAGNPNANAPATTVHLRATGASVTSWGSVVEAEGLTISDQTQVDFMQLQSL